MGYLTVDHITEENLATLDATILIDGFLRRVGLSQTEYVRRYVRECHSQGVLKTVLPTDVVVAMENSSKSH
jgi:hypothetical protein